MAKQYRVRKTVLIEYEWLVEATSAAEAVVTGTNCPARSHGCAEQRPTRSTSERTSVAVSPRSGMRTPPDSATSWRAAGSLSSIALGAVTIFSTQPRSRRPSTSLRSGPTRRPLPTVWQDPHLRAKRSMAGSGACEGEAEGEAAG